MSVIAPPDEMLREYLPVYRYLVERALLLQSLDPRVNFTSWYRDQRQNAAVGGNRESQHLFGFAFDVVGGRLEAVEQAANQLGLITVPELDHLHIQLFPAGFLRSLGFFSVEV